MNQTYTDWAPDNTHLFTTKDIKQNKSYKVGDSVYPVLRHNQKYYRMHMLNLKAISSYEKKQYMHFDTEQYENCPIGGYTKASGGDIDAVLYNIAMLRVNKVTFINILHKITIEDHPNEPEAKRFRWGTGNNYIDLKDKNDIIKCLLAIHAAKVLSILGIWDYDYLVRWIKSIIPIHLTPDQYSSFPIYSHIEILANHLLSCSLSAINTESCYSTWIHEICTKYIETITLYRDNHIQIDKEVLPNPDYKIHANSQEIQKLMVATLIDLAKKETNKDVMRDFFIRHIDSSLLHELEKQDEKDDQDIQSVLKRIIKHENLRRTLILKYSVEEAVNDLTAFCTHCKIYNIELHPNKQLEKALRNNPDFILIINQAMLENATIGHPKKYVHHTHESLLKRIDIDREILNSLKAPTLEATQRLCSRLSIKPFTDFESIDFDMLHAHLKTQNKDTITKLKSDTGCNHKRQLYHLVNFAQFSHTSMLEGRFRTPASLASGLQILNEDVASLIDDLPLTCRKHLSYISPVRLSYILFLLSLLSNL